ncbi:MAG: TraB/GumN family protein [Caulobacteraceae bacterium]|nr:TraB/GumN family protein [Caulobacteraceae bacterium]
MPRALRLVRLLLLLCALPAPCVVLAAAPAQAQPPVWVAHGPHATVVLFGSIHLLPPGLDWEPPELKTAIGQADDLWFEVPIDQAASLKAAQMAVQLGLEPQGHTLSEALSPETRARLAKAAQTCGLPMAGLDRLRPWYAELALSVASYRQYGAGVESGVEQTLSAANPAVPRRSFETVEQQIGFLADASEADQLASLTETLDELQDGPAQYQRLVHAWMAGDVAAIKTEALEPVIREAPGVYRTLVVERNRRWLGALTARLNGRGEAVVVVGVGHLIGPDSVPALLRKAGYKVDGP